MSIAHGPGAAVANRRQVLAVAAVLLSTPALAAADPAGGLTPYRAVFDERFGESAAFAARAAALGWAVRPIRGDVTDLWFHELGPRWKRGPATVVGLTGPVALFVLERLAWDAGLRVVSREADPKSGLVAWMIAPKGASSVQGKANRA